MLNPPITGNDELDSWLYQISTNGASEESDTLTTLPSSGEPVGYPYQFIHIKYGDDPVGGGFSNTPTNKMYWGVYNSTSSTESTNPADYTWFKSSSGFSTNIFLYYLILGNRNIKFTLATSQPSYKWSVDAGLAIDLDNIVPATTVSTSEFVNGIEPVSIVTGSLPVVLSTRNIFLTSDGKLYRWNGSAYINTVPTVDLTGQITTAQIVDNAITAIKIGAGQVSAAKLAVAAIDSGTGNLVANAVASTNIAAGAVTAAKTAIAAIDAGTGNLVANSVTSAQIVAGTIVASDIAAGTITANEIAGNTITAAKIAAGTITANEIAGSTITGAKIAAGTIAASNIAVGTITADRMNVSNLAAISANLGTITAGSITGASLTVGSSPAISGTTMTGSGALINSAGTFALGDSTRNIVNNGSSININGFTSFTKTSGAVTSTVTSAGAVSLSVVTTLLSSILLKKGKMFVAVNGTAGVVHKGLGARMIRMSSGIRIVDTINPLLVRALGGGAEQTCFAPAGSNTYPIRFTANTSFFTEDLIAHIGTNVNLEIFTNFEIFELGLPPVLDITSVYNSAEAFCTEFLV